MGGALALFAVRTAIALAANQEVDQMVADLAHDPLPPLTVIRDEVDLVFGREGVGDEERGRGGRVDQVKRVEEILRRRRGGGEP